jgi:hypothetical protein
MKRILLLVIGLLGFVFAGSTQCTPVISNCPAGTIYAGPDAGSCNATVDYNLPTFTGCPTGTLVQTAGVASGGSFPLGITTNTYEVMEGDVYFNEDFSDNSAGWTVGTEWQIGAAAVSTCNGSPDPGTDNTVSADNGVAGVVLGGCATIALHPYYYITSPVFDASAAPSLNLAFYRWLNSDYTPYMSNSVEVFDGAVWQSIWTSGASPGIGETSWNLMTYNISAYANASMQIRFGVAVGSSGAFSTSSWNLDDVVVSTNLIPTGVTCSFDVEVLNTGAVVTCPADIIVTNSSVPACAEIVTYTEPVDALACFGSTTGSFVSGTANGGVQAAGTTSTVVYQFVDDVASNSLLFSEDFSDNSAGWTLENEWAIGVAAVSSCTFLSDPGIDHTGTADNGIAGVVLGGCYSYLAHTHEYITSPVMDASSFTTLNLDFYRWLNSDYTPYTENTVEVYDGAAWQVIWASASPAIADVSWINQNFDIIAYANSALQVRFGFEVTSGSTEGSGWNLDDVTIYGTGTMTKDCSFDVTVESYNGVEAANMCQGSTLPFGSQTVTGAGVYTETWIGGGLGGCDSTVTLTVSELPVYAEVAAEAICDGETFVFGVQSLTGAGVYTELFQSVSGCDSTVNLTLTVNEAYDIAMDVSICPGESYYFGGTTYTASGVFTDVFTYPTGCDSLVTLTLSINPDYNEVASAVICANDSYLFGTQTLTAAGQYTEVFQSVMGCDSTVVLNLTIETVPTITVVSSTDEILGADGTIEITIAGTSTYTYLWSDGQTTEDASGLVGGTYTITVTDDATGCTVTETVIVDSQVGIVEILANSFTIHPNPSNGIFNVTVLSFEDNMRLEILNVMGQLIEVQVVDSETSAVNIQGVESGTYFVRVISESSIGVATIVIK